MKLLRVALLMSGITAILLAAGCGGGQSGPTPIAAGEEVTPTETPVPTSISVPTAASNPISSPSSTLPPISMALEAVSPELLACVQAALGSEQYNALISGNLDVTPQQVSTVIPCLMQYPQDTKAIMDMFGLDMGTIMGAGNPTPSATAQPTAAVPTPTPTSISDYLYRVFPVISPLLFEEWNVYNEFITKLIKEEGDALTQVTADAMFEPMEQSARENIGVAEKAAGELTLMTPPPQCQALHAGNMRLARTNAEFFKTVGIFLDAFFRRDQSAIFEVSAKLIIDERKVDTSRKSLGSGELIGDCNVR